MAMAVEIIIHWRKLASTMELATAGRYRPSIWSTNRR